MVVVAVAMADEQEGGRIFLPDWGKEVSPGGGDHLTWKSKEDTVLYASEGNNCRWEEVILCRSARVYPCMVTEAGVREGEGWTLCVHEGPTSYQTGSRMMGGGVLDRLMGSSTVAREGCAQWGAASRRRRDGELNVDVGFTAKCSEGWTTCVHEGPTSLQIDTCDRKRVGEGWTTCEHVGSTSCQASRGRVGGAVSWERGDKVLVFDICMKWCEGWTACVREGPTSYQAYNGEVGGGGFFLFLFLFLFLFTEVSTVTREGCTCWGAASWRRRGQKLEADFGITVKWSEGWTACMHAGSTSHQSDTSTSQEKERTGEG